MKTLEEFVKELDASAELQKDLKEAIDKGSLEEFLKKNGCAATTEEFVGFFKTRNEGEIGDDAVEAVAGGIQSKDFFSKIAEVIAQVPSLEPTVVTKKPKPYL